MEEKNNSYNESNFKINYTPARINFNKEKGTIEIPKSMFDKKNPEYHRMKLRIFSVMTPFEIMNIEGNIEHKVNVTNKRIHEWFDYAEKQLNQHRESKKFLKDMGEEVKSDWLVVGTVAKFKNDLIKKFWWRMGWFGIKQRIKISNVFDKRRRTITKFIKNYENGKLN